MLSLAHSTSIPRGEYHQQHISTLQEALTGQPNQKSPGLLASSEHNDSSGRSPELPRIGASSRLRNGVQIREISAQVLRAWLRSRCEKAVHKALERDCDLKDGIDQRPSKGGPKPTNRLNTSSENSPNNRYVPGNSSRKSKRPLNDESDKQHQDDDENDGNPREDGFDDSGSRRKRTRTSDKKFWACPFWKADPVRYSIQNNCKCATVLLSDISRVKQHLYRKHCEPKYRCQRCYEEFESELSLQDHTGQEIACSARLPKPRSQITTMQREEIRRKTPKKTEEECWYHIFKIIFLDTPLPQSPYMDEITPMQMHINDLRQYVPSEAANALRARMQNGLQQQLMHSITNGIGVEEAVNDVIETTVDMFMECVTCWNIYKVKKRQLPDLPISAHKRRIFSVADTQNDPHPSFPPDIDFNLPVEEYEGNELKFSQRHDPPFRFSAHSGDRFPSPAYPWRQPSTVTGEASKSWTSKFRRRDRLFRATRDSRARRSSYERAVDASVATAMFPSEPATFDSADEWNDFLNYSTNMMDEELLAAGIEGTGERNEKMAITGPSGVNSTFATMNPPAYEGELWDGLALV